MLSVSDYVQTGFGIKVQSVMISHSDDLIDIVNSVDIGIPEESGRDVPEMNPDLAVFSMTGTSAVQNSQSEPENAFGH